MLAQKYRLRLQKDFKKIYSLKKVAHTSFFTLYQAPSPVDNSRFAFIVAKHVSNKAVERNKIRRQMRSWVGKQTSNIKLKKDIIISTKKNALGKDFAKISQELEHIFKKARLL